jgi:hypothetical protein
MTEHCFRTGRRESVPDNHCAMPLRTVQDVSAA